jgi:GNAT superfamily N-acetyltransferase
LGVIVRRLEEDDVVENFDCKDEALNNFLKKHAWSNQQKISIGVTYVVVDQSASKTVLGYFTYFALATSAIPRDSFPKKHVRGLAAYDLPLILLARLAVDHRFEGKGLGRLLLREAFRISVSVSEQVGCRCIITDAYRHKVAWYAKYGFIPLEGSGEDKPTQRMFLDIRTLKAALKT